MDAIRLNKRGFAQTRLRAEKETPTYALKLIPWSMYFP